MPKDVMSYLHMMNVNIIHVMIVISHDLGFTVKMSHIPLSIISYDSENKLT
jgi:hypothetical protein